jgi:hypothetical protein
MAERLGKAGSSERHVAGVLRSNGLAKRFQKQIFLAVDIPTGFLSLGQGQQLVFEAEKGIVTTLKEIERDCTPK